MEYPGTALKRIVMAEHKNYVLMLAMFFGISVSFSLFWAVHAGNVFENIAYLILAASLIGLVISMPLFFATAGILHVLMRSLGGKGTWRNTYAVTGWALFPFSMATVVILPIELAAFGLLLFSDNPHPFDVKPLVYAVLAGIDVLLALWSYVIGIKGFSLAHAVPAWKSRIALGVVVVSETYVLLIAAGKLISTL